MKFDISELSLDNYIRKNNFQSDIINSTFVSNSSSVIFSKDIYDSKDISYSYDLYNGCIDCKDCYSGYGHAELSLGMLLILSRVILGYIYYECSSI